MEDAVERTEGYWAVADVERLADHLNYRIETYFNDLDDNGRVERWRRSIRTYYGYDAAGGNNNTQEVSWFGEQGEYTQLRINYYRSYLQHVHVLVAGERPALDVSAGADTADAMEQAILGRYLIDDGFANKGLEKAWRTAGKYCLDNGEGWVWLRWNPFGGEAKGLDDKGRIVYQGDVVVKPLRPVNVIRDKQWRPDKGPARWLAVRDRENRWDLAAMYPDYRDHIINYDDENRHTTDEDLLFADDWEDKENEDWCTVYRLYIAPSPAVPFGREVLLVGDTIIDERECKRIPLVRVVVENEEDSAFGHSHFYDLLGIQEAYDSFIATMLSNHDAFATSNVWTPTGSKLDVTELKGGLQHVESDEKPEVLNLAEISEHTYRVSDLLKEFFEDLTGVNPTVRGKPPASLESGNALALLDAKAVQYQSNYQAAMSDALISMAKLYLTTMAENITEERIAVFQQTVGTTTTKKWLGTDLVGMGEVVLEVGNPAMYTFASRRALADKWADKGWISGPEQYAQVMATGRATPVFKMELNEARLLAEENRRLISGEPVVVSPTDRHTIHIREHTEVFKNASERVRDGGAAMMAGIKHIQEHIEELRNADPLLLMAIGDPLAEAIASMAQGAAPPGQGSAPKPSGSPPVQGQPSELPSMPDMPVNPATGEPAPGPGEY